MEKSKKIKCINCHDTGYFVYFPYPNCEECQKGKDLKCWHCGEQECSEKFEFQD